LGLAGQTLVFGGSTGDLTAFSLKDGRRLWKTALGEKTKMFCPAPEGVVVVMTADTAFHPIRLADGMATEAPIEIPCQPLPSDRRQGDPTVRRESASSSGKGYGELDPNSKLTLRQGGLSVILGTREKGTRVPMVGALSPGGQLLWSSVVPATNPLQAQERWPEHATLTSDRVYVIYQTKEPQQPPRLVAFELGAGNRLWEAPLPTDAPIESVQASATHVFVSAWSTLSAFNPATGKLLYLIGDSD
jgi:outer membrane protein assembly factor BamB